MPNSEMPEAEAIERAKNGDDAGYEVLYRLHKRRVYSVCLRSTRSVPDAEDLTQEVFMLVYRRLSTFRGEASFGTWLYKVAINCVRMRLRENRPEVPLSVADPVGREYESRGCTLVLERAVLGQAIAKLSRSKRKVVLLHDVKGFTHREIAQCLGLAVSTSKSQLCRAHLLLRDVFGRSKRQSKR
jgi:RNA polymerase sigma-70 factor (ECF subfamily)